MQNFHVEMFHLYTIMVYIHTGLGSVDCHIEIGCGIPTTQEGEHKSIV